MRQVFVTPGNPGCAAVATLTAAPDHTPQGYLAAAREAGADLTVVGPEAPLVDGVVDAFRRDGRLIAGPSQAAAQLEGSKIFAKRFMERAGIPTARFAAAEDPETAIRALAAFTFPVVIKADGSVDEAATKELRAKMAKERGPVKLFDRGFESIEELKARCKADTSFAPPATPQFTKWAKVKQVKAA